MKAQEVPIRNKPKSFREKAGIITTSPFFIIEVIIVTSFLMFWMGGLGYFLGIAIVFVTFWSVKWDWSFFGLANIQWTSSLRPAFGYTLMILLLNDILVEPWVEILTGTPIQLEAFDGLRGNFFNFLIMLAIMWGVAAFGEEVLYRGYIMNRLGYILGNRESSWIIATLLSSIVFGVAHSYQGISGMLTTGMVGLVLGLAFYKNRDNLLVAILTHGIYDTYGLTMIYLGKESVIKNMMIEIYHSIFR